MYDSVARIANRDLSLQRLAGRVAHLNEALTMYARLAATTGDPIWEKRYRELEPELDNAIVGIATKSRAEYEKNYAAQTKLAYTKLIEMESLAFALVRKGRPKESSALLFSPDYENQKELYSQGINKMTEAVEQRIAEEITSFRRRMWHSGFLALSSLLLLFATWSGVILVVKRQFARRKKAEDDLAEEKERLAVTLRSIGEGVVTTDMNGKIVLMNRVAEELTGWSHEEARSRPLQEVFRTIEEETKSPTSSLVEQILRSPSVRCRFSDMILISRDGAERLIAASAAPILDRLSKAVGIVLVFRDITEQQHMSKEVLKAEKLESLGILAGGIAHDFNNILTAVVGNLSLAKMYADQNSEVFQRLSEAEQASLRARNLTQQLLTFSRGGAPIKRTAALGELLSEWVGFVLRGSNVKCEFQIDDDLRNVELDEGQVSRVIQNLCINADQAMPLGGRIFVSAQNCLLKQGAGLPLPPGEYVRIGIRDEGIGVPPENLQKIFDPYFTTKTKGSGLGLAASYATIKRHGGHITVDSKVGVGTTFTIFLPASERERQPTDLSPWPLREGKGKILLMDDEPAIRELASRMLTSLGYRVSATEDGREAIRLYQKSSAGGDPFDVVIMDLTIPGGMGGKEAIQKLRDFDPHVRAIVSSGYCNDPIMGDFKKYGFAGVLAKPYNAKEMSDALHSLIDLRRAG
jgi:PAS domain S-box-containing protein